MEYKLVIKSSKADIEDQVNKLMSEGWVPHGGISVCLESVEDETSFKPALKSEYIFTQAMIHD